ncbi:MAG: RNA polymerase sigma factor [Gammaproteobacteria bacterium]|nr:RNA polymerase sigma factor [Gammaproteobacteria bacterium]
MQTDEQLISLVVSIDDREAFSVLVKRHQSALRQFLRRVSGGDYALSDDIAQDSFILAYEKLAQFSNQGSFAAWLRTLAYRRFLRVVQTGASRFECSSDMADLSLKHDDAVEADIAAEKLMQQLIVEHRVALTLSYSEGMSHPEISQITGWPLGTVKSHIARAKQELKRYLERPQQVA